MISKPRIRKPETSDTGKIPLEFSAPTMTLWGAFSGVWAVRNKQFCTKCCQMVSEIE